MTSQTFSDEVRGQLARQRRTVPDLALHLGVSAATVYRRLNHGHTWPLDEAAAAAEFLGVPLAVLMTGERGAA